MQQKLDRLNLVLREGLTGVRVIRAFNRIDYEARRFDEANKDLTGTAVKGKPYYGCSDANADTDT